jgi:hypothetical protein
MIFRYLKFEFTGIRGTLQKADRSNSAEIKFTDINIFDNAGNRVDYSGATATWSTSYLLPNTSANNGIDGNNATNFGAYVNSLGFYAYLGLGYNYSEIKIENSNYVINFNKVIDAYNYSYTTNNDSDSINSDPVSWNVYYSRDGINYRLIDSKNNLSITTNRNTETEKFIFSYPICFNEGTKILCLNDKLEEEYVAIENLRKGDLVKSYLHGYKKIDLIGKNSMINNPDLWHECMYKMKKTKQNGLIEDLILTGGHAILVEQLGKYKQENDKIYGGTTLKIDDKYLLLCKFSEDFMQIKNNELYTYYHFTLESKDANQRFGVWANGLLTETTFKNDFLKHNFKLL